MEGRGCRNDETEKRRRAGGTPSGKTAEGGSGRGNDHGPTALGRLGKLGFLRNSTLPRGRVKNLVCGTVKRKKKVPGLEDSAPGKKGRKNDRPIISMMLHWNESQHLVKALLDTGCSVALINQQTIERLVMRTRTHKNPRTIENFTGEVFGGAGQSYTGIMRLQHKEALLGGNLRSNSNGSSYRHLHSV